MNNAAELHRQEIRACQLQDMQALRELLHDDYSYMESSGEITQGADAGVGIVEGYVMAFPDLELEITNQFSPNDDMSMIEFTARGTHNGELQGFGPSGKKIELNICSVIEMRDGLIYREREYFDNMSLMQQIGVVEMPSQAQYGQAAGSQ